MVIRCIRENLYWNLNHGARNLDIVTEELTMPAAKVPFKKFGLTSREIEILTAVLSGHSNRQIAENMSISRSTIKHHLTNIFDRLGVHNRLELALFSIHHALVERADHSTTRLRAPRPTPQENRRRNGLNAP